MRPRISSVWCPHHITLPSRRSSPRKRLRLQDSPPSRQAPVPVVSSLYSPSPDKQRRSPVAKRVRVSGGPGLAAAPSPELAIKGLSHAQLTGLVTSLLARHPHLAPEVAGLLPTPDLSHHEENLNTLKKNIYKALPSSRLLDSKNDLVAYNR